MNSEIVKSSRLKPNTGQVDGLPKNPRIIKDERFKKLCKSIEEHPEMMDLREVIAYDSGEGLVVIAGNMRLKACNELGIKDIPTKILPRETPIEKLKAYAIKDNIPYGEWDWEALKDSFPEFELAELGFTFEPVEFDEPGDEFFIDDDGGKENKIKTIKCPECGKVIEL